MLNSLGQDHAHYSVEPDMGPNCLQGSSADNKGKAFWVGNW